MTGLVSGILRKYGYKLSEIYESRNLVTAEGERTGRLVLVVSKESQEAEETTQRVDIGSVQAITTYITSYIGAIVEEYEKLKYKIDLREITSIPTEGTAGIIGKSIAESSRSLVPTMQEMERQVRKATAQAHQKG